MSKLLHSTVTKFLYWKVKFIFLYSGKICNKSLLFKPMKNAGNVENNMKKSIN